MNNAIIHKYAYHGRNQQPVMFIIFDQEEACASVTLQNNRPTLCNHVQLLFRTFESVPQIYLL